MKPILPLCLLLAAAAPAGAVEYAYMISAGEMRGMIEQNSRPMVIGYISGVMDAQMRAHEFCLPDGTSMADVGVRAYKMMGQQPRESKAPAADVIAVYLHGDFPCRK
jgi:hypothetical protein